MRKDDSVQNVKIFVSYSSRDRDMRELLIEGVNKHLFRIAVIKYEFWSDEEIDMGANWRTEIEKAINDSTVAILLVSASFASSPFIDQNELAEFLKRKRKQGYLILPVLIRTYNFQEFEELSSLNFFKTFYRDYGFNKPNDRNKLMPFDVLGENADTTEKQLQDYYSKLAEFIHKSVSRYLKKNFDDEV